MISLSMKPLKWIIVYFICLVCIAVPINANKKQNKDAKKPDKTRTYKEVKQGMVAVFPDIAKALQKVSTLHNENHSIELKFYLSPTGKMNFMGFVEPVSIDPEALMELKKALYMQVLIPVQEIETFTKVIVSSSLDKNNTIHLSDKIQVDYVEIRSKSNIMIVIDLNRRDFRKLYAKRWAKNPNLQGTMYVRLSINEFGKVVSCEKEKSTLNDTLFEKTIITKIKSWNFGKINNPGDVTDVVYPFTFSQ